MKNYKNKALRGAIMAALKASNSIGDHLIKMLLENTPYEASLEKHQARIRYLKTGIHRTH
jgi:hypothetical protein